MMKKAGDVVSMERVPTMARRLAPCLYLVAAILVILPLFDAVLSTAPFHFRNVQWRFGAIGLLTNTLLTPGLGFLLAVVTAVMLQHIGMQRVLAVLSWVVVAVLLGLLVMFALDALQTRPLVRPEMQLSFMLASSAAVCKLLVWMIAFGMFGRACRVPPALRRSAESGSSSLLIREAPAPSPVAGS